MNLNAFDPYAKKSSDSSNTTPTNNTTNNIQHGSNARHNNEDTNNIQKFLSGQRFPSGLSRTLLETHLVQQQQTQNQHAVPPPNLVWILDNSVHMTVADSHKISGTFDQLQNLSATTRWEELRDCVAYQVQAAHVLKLPISFVLLNDPGPTAGPQLVKVGDKNYTNIAHELQTLNNVMVNTRLDGRTSQLSKHLGFVKSMIGNHLAQLKQLNQTVTIVLATQGRPTNERGETDPNFIQTLQSFEGLPVYIILRLCTDDDDVIDYYNSLDKHITNVDYDVLDDFFAESLEVYLRNPWLTYGLPLHRFRELGRHYDVLDAMDERELTRKEVRDLCTLMFSSALLPDPDMHWSAFLQALTTLVAQEEEQWNPVMQKKMPWISMSHLDRVYGVHTRNSMEQPNLGYGQQQQQQQQQRPSPQYNNFQNQQQSTQQQHQQPNHPMQQPTANISQANAASTSSMANATVTLSEIKNKILTVWALQPPNYQTLRSIDDLLSMVQSILPPTIMGVERHDHFNKWKPVTKDALTSGPFTVLKRAVRKMQLFLHPDKLPHDLSEMQQRFCKELWDIISDAWNMYKAANGK